MGCVLNNPGGDINHKFKFLLASENNSNIITGTLTLIYSEIILLISTLLQSAASLFSYFAFQAIWTILRITYYLPQIIMFFITQLTYPMVYIYLLRIRPLLAESLDRGWLWPTTAPQPHTKFWVIFFLRQYNWFIYTLGCTCLIIFLVYASLFLGLNADIGSAYAAIDYSQYYWMDPSQSSSSGDSQPGTPSQTPNPLPNGNDSVINLAESSERKHNKDQRDQLGLFYNMLKSGYEDDGPRALKNLTQMVENKILTTENSNGAISTLENMHNEGKIKNVGEDKITNLINKLKNYKS